MYRVIVIVLALVVAGSWVTSIKDTPNDIEPVVPESIALLNAIDSAKDTKEAIEGRGVADEAILNLSGQKLDSVPKYIFGRSELTSLNLSHNLLTGALPAEIRLLSKLRILDLSDNNFTGVPAEIGQLTQLEVLDLSNNPITGLPHELAHLKNLKSFDLRNTNYSKADLEIIIKGLSPTVEILR